MAGQESDKCSQGKPWHHPLWSQESRVTCLIVIADHSKIHQTHAITGSIESYLSWCQLHLQIGPAGLQSCGCRLLCEHPSMTCRLGNTICTEIRLSQRWTHNYPASPYNNRCFLITGQPHFEKVPEILLLRIIPSHEPPKSSPRSRSVPGLPNSSRSSSI